MFYKQIILLTVLSLLAFLKPVYCSHLSSQTADSIHVISYNINLNITDYSNQSISGFTTLIINPRVNGVQKVLLDLLALDVDSVKLNGGIHPFSYNDTLLVIPLPAPAGPNDTIDVTVFYHGAPVADSYWGGFSFSGGTAYNLGVAFVSVPHCFGRVWFPCIDDFKDRSVYNCNITTTNDKMAVCGGTLISSEDHGNGTSTWRWRLSSPVPSYLASVAVSNYAAYTDVYRGLERNIPITIYVQPQDTARARASFIHLKDILAIFEHCFGPYRWERVGYVGVPFTGGAMEHATNIAYPNSCITGDLSYEDLYAHELSHHWFGDLVTCYRAEEMWLNEGWGRYCELLYTELLYGKNDYKRVIRANHRKSVQFNYVEDAGYLALSDVPQQYTYGSTVYDKGADVVHSLRNYMGDRQFFDGVKSFLDSNAFTDISIAKLGNFLQRHSGQNINGFLTDWVYQPGFIHYSVDSFHVNIDSSGIEAHVYIRQRVKGGSGLHTRDSLDITFMNDRWQKFTIKIAVGSALTTSIVRLPFVPDIVMADPEEKVSDATTDCYKTIKTSGTLAFEDTYFTLDVQNITDSAFLRIEHNWVGPDNVIADIAGIYRISDFRYWKVDGVFPAGFRAKGRFTYNRSKPTSIYSTSQGWLDHTLLTNIHSADSLVLLYRRNTSEKWRICSFVKSGGATSGYLSVTELLPGEYTLGIGNPGLSGIYQDNEKEDGLLIYPNPSKHDVHIEYKVAFTNAAIFDTCGKMVDNIKPLLGGKSVVWHPEKPSGGLYIVHISDGNRILCSGRFMVNR